MKNIFKLGVFALSVFIYSVDVKAQSFPATETEVKEILCLGKWVLDSVGDDKLKTTAKEAMMDDVTLSFKTYDSYSITMFGMDKKGKWTVSMSDKSVKVFEKKPEPESLVTSVEKNKLVMIQ